MRTFLSCPRKTCLLVLAFSLIVVPATAQPTTSAVLPEVLVTSPPPDAQNDAVQPLDLGKEEIPERQIPRTIDVLTRPQLDERAFTRVDEALKSMTGVTVTRQDGVGNYSTIQTRGFNIGALLLDGLPIADGANFASRPDLFLYERVELLRGPAGLLQGVGEPGGAVNLVRKRAPAKLSVEAGGSVGSFGLRRMQADLGSSLGSNSPLRGRLVAVNEHRDSYVDLLFAHKQALYGTLEWDMTPFTTLSIGATSQRLNSMDDLGLPARADGSLLDLPVSSFVGSQQNRQDYSFDDRFIELEHRFLGGGLVKAAWRSVHRDNFYRSGRADSPVEPDGSFTFARVDFLGALQDRSADLYLATPFVLAGRQHRLLLGASHNQREALNNNFIYGPSSSFDLNQRDYQKAPYPQLTLPGFSSRTEREERALYGQIQYSATERWRLLVGGRFSWAEQQLTSTSTGQITARSAPGRKFIPNLAVLVDIKPQLTAYASLAQSMVLQAVADASGRLLPPRRAQQVELGLKGDHADGSMQTRAALFRIDDRDRAMGDPEAPGAFVAAGQARSEGLELQANARPTARWALQASYAYTQTLYVRAPAVQQGQVFAPFTPRQQINLGARYAFSDSTWHGLQGLSVGGGVSWRSSVYAQAQAQAGPVQVTSAANALANLNLAYASGPHRRIRLAIENLFDKKYYEQVAGVNRQNFYGSPRSIVLSLDLVL